MLSLITAFLLLPTAIVAASFDCSKVLVDGKDFDLSSLGGPKDVHWARKTPPSITNTTFTVDICQPLKRPKNLPSQDKFCKSGTWICGIEWKYSSAQGEFQSEVIPIAGTYPHESRHLEPKLTRLRNSASNSDSAKEGVRVEFHGGLWNGEKQEAIIEFLCDKDKKGTEGFEGVEQLTEASRYGAMHRREESDSEDGDDDEDDGDEGELPGLDKDKALKWESYDLEDGIRKLRMTWSTSYACENATHDDESGGKPSSGEKAATWGFFTWLLIIVFMLAASYIIFGSWLNYNRYGARGWDLIPHGDTIRDIPYIIKDWSSGLVERMRGGSGGSRGGYSAV